MYASLDTIKSLQIYFEIYKLQDLSLRLKKIYFIDNLNKKILPVYSNLENLTLATAAGSLTSIKKTKLLPLYWLESLKVIKRSVIVKIEQFFL